MAHRELTYWERRRIEDLLADKVPVARIAVDLGRHRSTVYREIGRNAFRDAECPELAGYYGMVAHGTAKVRRARRRKLIREPELRGAVEDRLKAGWSPEQIAGRLKHEGSPLTVCHETIYTHAYGHKDLARHLPRRQKRRKPRRSRKPRDLVFPESCRIKHRPKEVAEREVFGHWEADLMIFRREHGPANVATMVERKTRYAVLFKNNDRKSKPIMDTIINTLAPLPADARQSITFDRGFEFSAWRELGTGIGAEAWFCDPQAPWQKGAVENLNLRARRDLPRDTQLTAISNRSMKSICDRLNATPRKCLGYRTPTEAFAEELRKLQFK